MPSSDREINPRIKPSAGKDALILLRNKAVRKTLRRGGCPHPPVSRCPCLRDDVGIVPYDFLQGISVRENTRAAAKLQPLSHRCLSHSSFSFIFICSPSEEMQSLFPNPHPSGCNPSWCPHCKPCTPSYQSNPYPCSRTRCFSPLRFLCT